MAYEVNYDDKRFTEVTTQKNEALKESEKNYGQMIENSDKHYQNQIDAVENWGDKQSQLQQEQNDFAIEQIEQQKQQAEKDYKKEQSAAYVDWQKQSNDYGTNAEKMAQSGLASSGYSESSQVSLYNTYQKRVATARESFNKAVLDYNNAMTEARLQNSSVLAEIAYKTLLQSLELSLQGFQYKNQLVLEKATAKKAIDDTYYSRYQNVLAQINTENALAEQIRQYNESLAFQKEQFAWQKKKSSVSGSRSYSSGSGTVEDDLKIKDGDEDELTVDKKSITALGRGPINPATLNKLVESGEVIEYEQDGKLKYRNANSGTFNN